jgi:hypothetical protein
MVSINDTGSLDTAQWNLVQERVTWLAAKEELILRNHDWGDSAQ